MVGFLIATHGKLAEGLLDSMTLIAGKQEKIETLSITHETSIEEFEVEMAQTIQSLDDGSGVIVFTDILLASPFNKATSCYRTIGNAHKFMVLSGVNLPMLLEAFSSRISGKNLDDITKDAVNAGREGVTEFFSHMEHLNGGIKIQF